ncbi:MAG: cob(I)yrinic acid a,c-diamide adenosyltransferase [Candidatus Thorarchaeota archaeon]
MTKRIYTGAGDKGQTSLRSGERIDKDDVRVEAYGTIDELNSFLGFAKRHSSERIRNYIHDIQQLLFFINAELASTDSGSSNENLRKVLQADVEKIEKIADELSEELPLLTNFVIPGGSDAGAVLHICRTICRRAERRVLTLSKVSDIDSNVTKYLNRLSDLLFVFSRYENVVEGDGDQLISRDGIRVQRKD